MTEEIKNYKKQISELQSVLFTERRLRDRDRFRYDIESDRLRNQIKDLVEFIKTELNNTINT